MIKGKWLWLVLLTSCIGVDIVEEIMMPEVLRISSAILSITVGDTVSFSADYFNEQGEMTDVPLTWISEDASIISIDNSGQAVARSEGSVWIWVQHESLRDSVQVMAGDETIMTDRRTAEMQGLRNYSVEGDAVLEEVDEVLVLNFAENFSASNGPGLHVYLSNNAESVDGGVDLGELKSNSGAQTYDLPSTVELNTYDFVIIHCQPFNVPFGNGKFE